MSPELYNRLRFCKGTAQADRRYEARKRTAFNKRDFPPTKRSAAYAVNLHKWALNKDRRDGNCGGKQANKNADLLWTLQWNMKRQDYRISPMIWHGWKLREFNQGEGQ